MAMSNTYEMLEERIFLWGLSNVEIIGWKALIVSFELFNRLSSEVAAKYNFTYPDHLFSHIQTWLGVQHDKHR